MDGFIGSCNRAMQTVDSSTAYVLPEGRDGIIKHVSAAGPSLIEYLGDMQQIKK